MCVKQTRVLCISKLDFTKFDKNWIFAKRTVYEKRMQKIA